MHDISSLEQYNTELTREILTTKGLISKKRQAYWYTTKNEYVFQQLTDKIQAHIDRFLITHHPEIERIPCLIHRIDVSMYGADFTIKFDTSIVRALGKWFASEFVPQIVATLQAEKHELNLSAIEQKGIYINCTLDSSFWWTIGKQILSLGDRYGDIDIHARQVAIAEYSSPNAAKHLHAGHVRSTVIGYVLSNIYEHTGYTVHRINHINDRGGFGQLIEGWKRWHELLYNQGFRDNDLNYQIYTIFRQAEKLVKHRQDDEAEQLAPYFITSNQEAFTRDYDSFQANAVAAFHALEAGDPDVFAIRKEIVASSLIEFKTFYDKLDITHDYTIGESFYEKIGRQCIEEGKKAWRIVTFTQKIADQYIQDFDSNNQDIEPEQRQKKHEEMLADIDAEVVLLDNRERFVVLRSDGGSIYATRDIWCLWFRTQTRAPSLIMYEVGQEQEDHFQKLFETADKLGWLDREENTKTTCLHIAHGFYVDAISKKKLSSRAGASNVHTLVDATITYFKDKYAGRDDFTPEEINHNARTLGIASIIINDLSKSRMDPVLVSEDLTKTIAWFEQSGGAYLIYTICRAKSLLKKATVNRTDADVVNTDNIRTHHQIALLQQCSEFPGLLEKACLQHEPSVLVQYAYHLTQSFNSMYGASDRMVDDAQALQLTACYIQIMTNVLRICNIEPLERM